MAERAVGGVGVASHETAARVYGMGSRARTHVGFQ